MSEHRKQAGIGFWLVAVLAMVVLYALSVGPAIMFVSFLPPRFNWVWDVVVAFYYPLDMVLPDSGPVYNLVEAYINFWSSLATTTV